MLKVYSVSELVIKEQVSKQSISYRIRKGGYYIPVKLEGSQFSKSTKGYTVRYLIKSELKDYIL